MNERLFAKAAAALARIRAERPLVMCITNRVVENFTANCLLALGARPAMIVDRDEAAELARIAHASLVNVGTVDDAQARTMKAAAESCVAAERPWALDPVGVQLLARRRSLVLDLVDLGPSIVRGNAEEIESLRAEARFAGFAAGPGAVLATGAVDEIRAGDFSLRLARGVPALARVTGTGCAQGALAAAFLAVERDPALAALGAVVAMAAAGERAAKSARAPGSFAVALVDSLYALDDGDFHD